MTEPTIDRPLCKCHGEPMVCPSRWSCAIANRAKNARWRAENPEKKRAENARWRAENPEKKRAANARWWAENPEKRRAAKARELTVCGIYLGTVGFTQRETEAMLSGASK